MAKPRDGWRALTGHPMIRLELQRIRRKRWWPGRRFFLFYPAVLGAALGTAVALALNRSPGVQLSALVTGLPVVCLLATVTWLLSLALPWIAPALTAASIARERELGTIDLLRTTLLTERSIVLGKLGSCLARLWPAILTLLLLTPLQLVGTVIGGVFSASPAAALVAVPGVLDAEPQWGWLALLGALELLGPWSHLALHAAVGLFVSAVCRTSGTAIAITYGAILVVRGALWLVDTLLASLWWLFAGTALTTSGRFPMLLGLSPLAIVLVETGGAALLVWGAIWRLGRE